MTQEPLVMYRGEDADEMFARKLQLEAKQLFDEYIAIPRPMLLTATESQSFTDTTICHICTKPLGGDKVQDHYHITGNYRGAAHNECNLMYRISKTGWKQPVIIHNLKGYEGHLIVKALKSECDSAEYGEVSFCDGRSINIYRFFSVFSTRSGQTCKDS